MSGGRFRFSTKKIILEPPHEKFYSKMPWQVTYSESGPWLKKVLEKSLYLPKSRVIDWCLMSHILSVCKQTVPKFCVFLMFLQKTMSDSVKLWFPESYWPANYYIYVIYFQYIFIVKYAIRSPYNLSLLQIFFLTGRVESGTGDIPLIQYNSSPKLAVMRQMVTHWPLTDVARILKV